MSCIRLNIVITSCLSVMFIRLLIQFKGYLLASRWGRRTEGVIWIPLTETPLGLMSEYACRLRLIVSQTQVDFKAEEYVDSAYIAYIHDRVLRQLYKKPKHGKSQK